MTRMLASGEFQRFYQQHHGYVHALCCRRVATSSDADDLESIVWCDVHESFERFHGPDAKRMLVTLVSWRAKDLFRRRYRRHECDVEDEILVRMLDQQTVPTSGLEERVALQQSLQQEAPLDRQLLFGRYVEGLSWGELAQRHDSHRNTVSRRAEQALRRVRRRLEATYTGGLS